MVLLMLSDSTILTHPPLPRLLQISLRLEA
jgi:hypothetical protein